MYEEFKTPLNNKELREKIQNCTFVAPLANLYAVVGNPEYDIESFSEELEKQHGEWCHSWHDGPFNYQGYDEFGNYHEEDEEHKAWRLNHNKKYEKMKIVTIVTPKKIKDNEYKIDDSYILDKIIERFQSYTVYNISKN